MPPDHVLAWIDLLVAKMAEKCGRAGATRVVFEGNAG
jgi:hypothetical protein